MLFGAKNPWVQQCDQRSKPATTISALRHNKATLSQCQHQERRPKARPARPRRPNSNNKPQQQPPLSGEPSTRNFNHNNTSAAAEVVVPPQPPPTLEPKNANTALAQKPSQDGASATPSWDHSWTHSTPAVATTIKTYEPPWTPRTKNSPRYGKTLPN